MSVNRRTPRGYPCFIPRRLTAGKGALHNLVAAEERGPAVLGREDRGAVVACVEINE